MASQKSQRPSISPRAGDNQQQIVVSPYPGGYPPQGSYPPCYMMPFPQPGPSGGPVAPWPYPPVPMNSWGALSHPHATPGQGDPSPDHYTVDSMRRIYSNEDASIEIERVKVQRRQQQFIPSQSFSYPYFSPNFNPNFPHNFAPGFPPNFPPNFPSNFTNIGVDSKGLVPAIGPATAPVRRPPPRKNRKNKLNNQLVPSNALNSGSHPPTYPYPAPYFSYVPYPYPYPYFSYPALQDSSVPAESLPPTSQVDSGNSKNETVPQRRPLELSDSQQIDSGPSRSVRDSTSPDAGRPLSPNAPSQISLTTESISTDINPSDSVSVGGYRKSGRTSRHESDKDNHWMIEMQKHLASIDALSEEGDRSSFATAQSDVPTPPVRRRRPKYDSKQASIDSTSDHCRQPLDIDKQERTDSVAGHPRPPLSREEASVNFKQSPKESKTPSDFTKKKADTDEEQLRQAKQAQSQVIEVGHHRNMSQQQPPSSFADDISIKNKTSEVDSGKTRTSVVTKVETGGEERIDAVPSPKAWRDDDFEAASDDHSWVLLTKEEAPDVASVWLADVSVWRARLVVALDKGQGLDQQDWATFHLLTQHPLPVALKLSMLHAPRLCAANADVGAGQVRAALLQLARHAQVLLQQEDDRPSGWKSIPAASSQPWAPVKGGKEILRLLGFRYRDDGNLRYSRRLSLEVSHVARLTLDMLLLADELRLYLTGGHPHPSNISDLFCPVTAVSPPLNSMTLRTGGEALPVYHSSADFISAETTPVLDRKVGQGKQLRDFNDLNANDSTLKVSYNEQLLHRTSSEEDITLHENGATEEGSAKTKEVDTENENTVKAIQRPPSASSQGGASTVLSDTVSLSTDIASLPELQSAASPVPSKGSNYKTLRESPKNEGILHSPKTISANSKSVANHANMVSTRREDHIYEEIGEIRSQVQKLRTSVSVPNLPPPPPLPPKYRSEDGDNSSTYSRSDWSASSSIGGSTGRRRRKRRAPLPPSFMRLSIKENVSPKGSHGEQLPSVDKTPNTAGRNPFYDEIGENKPKLPVLEEHKDQESKSSNPFYDTKIKPSGYVGANPFYEDVKKIKANSMKEGASQSSADPGNDSQSPDTTDRTISNEQVTCVQIGGEKANNAEQHKLTESESTVAQQTPTPLMEQQKNVISIPSEMELHDIDLNSTTGDNEPNSFQAPTTRSLETQTKNVEQKQLRGSQGVVSADQTGTESNDLFTQANESSAAPSMIEMNESQSKTLNQNATRDSFETLASVNCFPHEDHNAAHRTHLNAASYSENSQNSIGQVNEDSSKKLSAEGVLGSQKTKGSDTAKSHASTTDNRRSCSSAISDIPYIDSSDVMSYKTFRDSNSQISSGEICRATKLPTPLLNTPPFDPPPPPPSTSPPPSLSYSSEPELNQPFVTPSSALKKSIGSTSSSQIKLNDLESHNSFQSSTAHEDLLDDDSKFIENNNIIISATHMEDEDERLRKLDSEEINVKSAVIFGSGEGQSTGAKKGATCGEYYEIPEHPDQPPPLPAKPNSLRLQKVPELPPKLLKSSTVNEKKISESESKCEAAAGLHVALLAPDNDPLTSNRDELSLQQPTTSCNSNAILPKSQDNEEVSELVVDDSSAREILNVSKNKTLPKHLMNNSPNRSPSKPPRRQRMTPQNSTMPRLPPKTKYSSASNSQTQQQKYRTLPTVSSGSPSTKKRSSVQLSLSTPSSPRPSTKPPPAKLSHSSKSRKSWPFLLCDCLYTDNDKHESIRSRRRL